MPVHPAPLPVYVVVVGGGVRDVELLLNVGWRDCGTGILWDRGSSVSGSPDGGTFGSGLVLRGAAALSGAWCWSHT